MKLLTITVPCYNSQDYMEKCIDSLLIGGEDVEIIIVDDGSVDRTGEIADAYAKKFPEIVRVIHQENGGHGSGLNAGINHATGLYFKVVDSDDWVDPIAYEKVLKTLRNLCNGGCMLDMLISNFVYEKEGAKKKKVIRYNKVLPEGQLFDWSETKNFPIGKYILMHSVIYRTKLLRDCHLILPKHTFYVDNLYMYHPFPHVKSIYYMDLDLYYYFIGRDDQSVNKANMIKRIDQQILVTQLMTKCYDLSQIKKTQPKLHKYMLHELSMMYMISTVFLFASKKKENYEKNKQLWKFLEENADPETYKKIKWRSLNTFTRLPGPIGRGVTVAGYNISKKIFKFN